MKCHVCGKPAVIRQHLPDGSKACYCRACWGKMGRTNTKRSEGGKQ